MDLPRFMIRSLLFLAVALTVSPAAIAAKAPEVTGPRSGKWAHETPKSLAPDPQVVIRPLDPSPLPLSYRDEDGLLHYNGNYHERARCPGSDVDVCFGGRIAASLLSV